MAARSTFPLRVHDDSLRDLVREVAGQSGVSQNELIELAVLHEVVRRGLLQAAHLERAGTALAEMSARAYGELVERSLSDMAVDWHTRLYAACRVPGAGYVGHLRGDAAITELIGYEVGVGPDQPDGLPEKLGVWSTMVQDEVATLLRRVSAAVRVLDGVLPPGHRPNEVEQLRAVVCLAAQVHGERVRTHPLANGNGRTARVWVAWLCLRYQLPMFLTLGPRPSDVAYAVAGHASMGRPPTFHAEHPEAEGVFTYLLTLSLMP